MNGTALLGQLASSDWIGFATRAVLFDAVVLNDGLGTLTDVNCMFELDPSGAFVPSTSFRSIH